YSIEDEAFGIYVPDTVNNTVIKNCTIYGFNHSAGEAIRAAVASDGYLTIDSNTIYDVRNVLELVKIDKPKKITLFVSESWKYDFFKKLKSELEKTRNQGELIKKLMVKGHEQDVPKIILAVLNDASKLPQVVLSQKEEFDMLKDSKKLFEDEFKTTFEFVLAEKSKEQKAKQASPGKPAIFVE
ncbi:MAG: hypothetical protein QXR60_04570, partial [Candidatus Nanoarchaeia archaeon]